MRDLRALEAAIAQPKATFGGEDLYPTLVEKAACLCFSLVQGHVDEQERVMLALASGRFSRTELVTWLEAHAHRAAGPA